MKYSINGVQIIVTEDETVVEGSVKVHIAEFEFDSSWEKYTLIAVFKRGGELREQVIKDGKCEIPWEVLQKGLGGYLVVGVYGITGTARRPTLWAAPKVVHPGAAEGEEARKPTPDIYQQLLDEMKNAKPMVVILTQNADGTYTPSHTATEIAEHIKSGGLAFLKDFHATPRILSFTQMLSEYYGDLNNRKFGYRVFFSRTDLVNNKIEDRSWVISDKEETASLTTKTHTLYNLDNYYPKKETYSREEIDAKIKNTGASNASATIKDGVLVLAGIANAKATIEDNVLILK